MYKTRRSYLKKQTSKFDSKPDPTMAASLGLSRDINPINATPKRAILWLNTHRHTPTITEPMKERVESWRHHIKDERSKYSVKLKPTAFTETWLCYDGYDNKTIYWLEQEDKLLGVKLKSVTFSNKARLLELYETGKLKLTD